MYKELVVIGLASSIFFYTSYNFGRKLTTWETLLLFIPFIGPITYVTLSKYDLL